MRPRPSWRDARPALLEYQVARPIPYPVGTHWNLSDLFKVEVHGQSTFSRTQTRARRETGAQARPGRQAGAGQTGPRWQVPRQGFRPGSIVALRSGM